MEASVVTPNILELKRLIAAARSAAKAVDAADELGCSDCQVESVRFLVKARLFLADWIINNYELDPVALVLPDGSLVTFGTHHDGICIVQAEHVHKVG